MGKIISISGEPIDPLAEAFRRSFYDHGQAQATIDQLACTAAEWRATARRIAKELKRPVQTLEGHGTVYAVLRDWPRDDRERTIAEAAMRRAVKTLPDYT